MAVRAQITSEDRAAGGQRIEGSLRFDGSHSDHLKRSFGIADGTKKTFSFWVKRGKLAATQCIFSTDVSGYIEGRLAFLSSDIIQITDRDSSSGSTDADLQTSAAYRDPDKWYHIVFAYDTTDGTGGDRMRLYIDGVEETAFGSDTNPAQDYATSLFRAGAENYIGCNDGSDWLYANLSQVYYIDGAALAPTEFGYTDPLTGKWRPKKYTGDYNVTEYNTTDATGGNTILNTNDSGSTITSGYRTDSSAGTTANQGLVLAWPGNVVNGDVHDHINTGSSAKTVAAESDAEISTTQSKFYGSSGYINKTSDCFRVTDHADLALGSGDYTVEMWHYPTELFNNAIIYDGRHPTTNWPTSGGGFALITNGTGVVSTYTSGAYVCQTDADAVTTNAWYHIAVVRSSGTQKIYINGIEKASASNSTNHTEEKAVLGAGANSGEACAGYFNDWRIYKGTAKYTSAFNPPMVTAGTASFYLPFDGVAPIGIDQSGRGNNWTPVKFGDTTSLEKGNGAYPILNTVNGVAAASGGVRGRVGVAVTVYNDGGGDKFYLDDQKQGTVKFVPGQTVTFDTSDTTVGGHPFRLSAVSNGAHAADYYSVDLDGTGDYLSWADTDDLDMGTGDFTQEFWVYPDGGIAAGTRQNVLSNLLAWGAGYFVTQISHTSYVGKVCVWDYSMNSSAPIIYSNTKLEDNKWYHIAIVRSGTTFKIFIDGILDNTVGSLSGSVHMSDDGMSLGYHSSSGTYANYIMSDLRVVKGTALYSSDFQPPITPLTNVSGTQLLCCNQSTTTGSTVTPGTITANGDPTSSTSNPYDTYVYGTVTSISEGTAGAATTITIPSNSPSDLYYYCTAHSGMGGAVSIGATDASVADPGAWKCTLAMPLNDKKWSSNPEVDDWSHLVNCTTYITPNLAAHGDVQVSRKRGNLYGSSYYFDGNGDFVQWSQGGSASATDPTALTGNFTMEAWIYPTAAAHTNDGGIISRGANGATAGYTFSLRGSSSSPHNDKLSVYFNFPAEAACYKTDQTIEQNRWTHVCATKEGTADADVKLYVNGVLDVGTVGTNAVPTMGGSDNYWIGCTSYGNDSVRQFEGYISDVRIYKDFVKYRNNFTLPSAHPSLLPDVTSGVAYAPEEVKLSSGSVQIDGANGSYLSWAPGADVAFGTGDFTVEGWWYYRVAPDQHDYLIDCRNSGQTTGTWSLSHEYATESPSGTLQFSSGSAYLMQSSKNPTVNQWNHIAVTRSGNALKMFINGEQTASATDTTNFSTEPTKSYIGTRHSVAHTFDGWMSNLRIVKGTAVYTQNFSVPTQALTAISGTTTLIAQSTTAENAVATGGNTGGVNNGTVWSDHITWTNSTGFGTVEADQPHNMFDGDDSTGAQLQGCSDPNTIIFTPPGGISYSSTVKAYIGNATCTVSVNEGSFDAISSGWNTLVSGSGTLTSIRIRRPSSSGAAANAFKIDDVYLLDPMNKHGYAELSEWNPFDKDINTTNPNEYATLSPINTMNTNATFSDGNLQAQVTGPCTVASSIPMVRGKWYCEIINTAHGSTHTGMGICKIECCDGARQPDEAQHRGGWGMWHISGDGSYKKIGFGASWGSQSTTWEDWGATWGTNGDYDVMGMALDMDNRTLTYYKNGKNMGTNENNLTRVLDWGAKIDAANDNGAKLPNTSWAAGDHGMVFVIGNGQTGATSDFDCNFGQKPWKYAPPPGYQAATLANCYARPTHVRPDKEYFGVTTYIGNGTTQSITGLGFQPDLVWIKVRTAAYNHVLYDSIRGPFQTLEPSATSANNDRDPYGVTSFDKEGFTVKGLTNGDYQVNGTPGGTYSGSSGGYVGWCWKAGGKKGTWNVDGEDRGSASAAGLTAGDTSVLNACSINTKAGFSIVKWTQDSAGSSKNIAHGLSKAPSFVIMKHINNTSNWYVVHTAIENEGKIMYLNTNSDQDTSSDFGGAWPGTTYTATSTTGVNGRQVIMYSWTNTEGVQKFGQYEGNGDASKGIYVELGFKPAMIIIKRVDSDQHWRMWDNARSTYNPRQTILYPNDSGVEGDDATYRVDFLEKGFKMYNSENGINTNGSKFSYCAWAETPTSVMYGS